MGVRRLAAFLFALIVVTVPSTGTIAIDLPFQPLCVGTPLNPCGE